MWEVQTRHTTLSVDSTHRLQVSGFFEVIGSRQIEQDAAMVGQRGGGALEGEWKKVLQSVQKI